MPKTELFTLKSAQDGLALSLVMVEPDVEPACLVQLAHGMSEHKERYLPFMHYLAERGCLCVMNDHRGHGASVHRREDLGYFYENGDVALVEDLHQISQWMKQKYPGKKLFLFGHSMGSLAVRAYCNRYAREIDSLVVCGSPGFNALTDVAVGLVNLISLFKGERHRSAFMQSMTVGAFARRFPDPDHPCAWLSANMDNVKAYEADPLCSFVFTLNGNRSLLKLMQQAYRLKSGRSDLPVHFYSGAEDPCMSDEKGFRYAMDCMKKAGYTDVRGHLFPGLRHEILNETGCEAIFERIWSEAFQPYI